jgi:hypothetical protein
MKIARETWIIAAIGIADLMTTIVFIRNHGAQEANPLFRHYWEMGIPAFIMAKLVCLAGPLLVLEWARRSNPRFVSRALRTAIVGYLSFYIVGYMQLNGPKAAAAELVPSQASQVFLAYEMHAAQYKSFRFAHMLKRGDGDYAFWPMFGRHSNNSNCRRMWKFAAPSVEKAAYYTGLMERRNSRLKPMDD